jgi:hypothetical protein
VNRKCYGCHFELFGVTFYRCLGTGKIAPFSYSEWKKCPICGRNAISERVSVETRAAIQFRVPGKTGWETFWPQGEE